jgi:hypothetical protein
MTNLYIYFLLAAMALEFLFALWANYRAQSVLDAFITHPQLYEAAQNCRRHSCTMQHYQQRLQDLKRRNDNLEQQRQEFEAHHSAEVH